MKVGIKTYTDKEGYEYVKKIIEYCDFIELLIIPDDDVWKKFKDYDIPMTIHAAHQYFGCSPSLPSSEKRTRECIGKAIEAADLFNSKQIVVHPGSVILHKRQPLNMDIKDADINCIKMLKTFDEPRFLIENLPTLGKKFELGTYPEDISKLMKGINCGFCFDFSHAVLSSPWIGIGYKELVKNFMKLNPKYFHMCGGSINGQYDHKGLMEGDFDVAFFKSLLPKDAMVVLETPHNAKTHIRDLNFVRQ